jgi:thiazole synthase ThiGH ThiG subunit
MNHTYSSIGGLCVAIIAGLLLSGCQESSGNKQNSETLDAKQKIKEVLNENQMVAVELDEEKEIWSPNPDSTVKARIELYKGRFHCFAITWEDKNDKKFVDEICNEVVPGSAEIFGKLEQRNNAQYDSVIKRTGDWVLAVYPGNRRIFTMGLIF